MKRIAVALVLLALIGCELITGPGESETFKMEASGGHKGKPIGSCKQKTVDRECQSLGYQEATSFNCGSVHVSGGFFGSFDQAVLYEVTCWRR